MMLMRENKENTGGKSSPLGIGLLLNAGFTVFELAVGTLSGSLALVADGTHNLTDSLTLGVAYLAERIGQRQADERRTYGYGRVKIVASLLNAGVLAAVAFLIGYEAIQRLSHPRNMPGLVVAGVAAAGIVINGSVAYLMSGQRRNLNIRSAYVNMLYDTLSSVGALVAGLAIAVFGWNWLDSAVGIAIAFMLMAATFGIVKDALKILLEGVPPDIDLAAVKSALGKQQHVRGVDDVHAWTIDNEYYAFSCHLVVDASRLPDSRQIVENAKDLLANQFGFKHSTIELELEDSTRRAGHEQH